jgi:hypothetical protein
MRRVQLFDLSVSQPEKEFLVEFVRYGTETKPASRLEVRVLASKRDHAIRIVRKVYPRSGEYRVVSATNLPKQAA